MNYPPILILGASGSGKSSSLANLNPEKTLILNVERKVLPFRHALKFKHNKMLKTHKEVQNELELGLKNESIDTIVLESLSAFSNELLAFSKKINKGYDIYNFFNSEVGHLLNTIKNAENKWIVVIGIDELVEFMSPMGSRSTSRRCEIRGKEWEGKVEKEFTLVFFTEVLQPDKNQPPSYNFITNNDGTNSAKSPQGMFKNRLIPNDVAAVIKVAKEYWEIPTGEDVEKFKVTN